MTTLFVLAMGIGLAIGIWADNRWPRPVTPVPMKATTYGPGDVDADGFIVGDGYDY